MNVLFVTGRLAEQPLRRVVGELGGSAGILPEVAVLGISVAALMHVEFVRRKLRVPQHIDRVVLPGWCQGDLPQLDRHFGKPFERGPKDLHDLPEFFGQKERSPIDLSRFDIEILAEINHVPRLSDAEIVKHAEDYRAGGADVIDLGCIPGERWPRAAAVTHLLRDQNFRVSIDSFDRREVEEAVSAGIDDIPQASCQEADGDPLTADQRGFPRPFPAAMSCDIGAYEQFTCAGVQFNQPGAFSGCPSPVVPQVTQPTKKKCKKKRKKKAASAANKRSPAAAKKCRKKKKKK